MRLRVTIPDDVHKELTSICARRGISLSEYVAVALRAMPKDDVILEFGSIMPLGKYRGALVEPIVQADPAYVLWMNDNVSKVRFARDVVALAHRILDPKNLLA